MTTELDDMIARAYTLSDYPQFIKLAKRKIKRLRKQRDERARTQKVQWVGMLKALPELRKRRA